MLRRRRVKLTATQLLGRNQSEALVDKDNHACDGNKYVIMTRPEPTMKTRLEFGGGENETVRGSWRPDQRECSVSAVYG